MGGEWEVAVILTKATIERLSSMQGVDHNSNGEPPAEMDAEIKTLVAEAASKVAKLPIRINSAAYAATHQQEMAPTSSTGA